MTKCEGLTTMLTSPQLIGTKHKLMLARGSAKSQGLSRAATVEPLPSILTIVKKGKAQLPSVTDIVNEGHVCLCVSTHNARALKQAHRNGMQPSLMLNSTCPIQSAVKRVSWSGRPHKCLVMILQTAHRTFSSKLQMSTTLKPNEDPQTQQDSSHQTDKYLWNF